MIYLLAFEKLAVVQVFAMAASYTGSKLIHHYDKQSLGKEFPDVLDRHCSMSSHGGGKRLVSVTKNWKCVIDRYQSFLQLEPAISAFVFACSTSHWITCSFNHHIMIMVSRGVCGIQGAQTLQLLSYSCQSYLPLTKEKKLGFPVVETVVEIDNLRPNVVLRIQILTKIVNIASFWGPNQPIVHFLHSLILSSPKF